jgi:hypothetical protein
MRDLGIPSRLAKARGLVTTPEQDFPYTPSGEKEGGDTELSWA